MTTDLAKGIVDGKTLREWWETAPHGAFQAKCAELGIKLEFGEKGKDKRYSVEIRYTFSGYGYRTVEVEAESEAEAEGKALEAFEGMHVDFVNGDVEDAEVHSVDEMEEPRR